MNSAHNLLDIELEFDEHLINSADTMLTQCEEREERKALGAHVMHIIKIITCEYG